MVSTPDGLIFLQTVKIRRCSDGGFQLQDLLQCSGNWRVRVENYDVYNVHVTTISLMHGFF